MCSLYVQNSKQTVLNDLIRSFTKYYVNSAQQVDRFNM